MKLRIVFVTTIIVALAACSNTAQTVETKAVQNDTIRPGSNTGFSASDSVIKNGDYIKRYENGVVEMRGMMKDGKREGLWKSWYQNGAPWSETTFSNGIKNGRTSTWYENEQKRYDGFYTNDDESGKWTYWDEKGKVVSTKDYGTK